MYEARVHELGKSESAAMEQNAFQFYYQIHAVVYNRIAIDSHVTVYVYLIGIPCVHNKSLMIYIYDDQCTHVKNIPRVLSLVSRVTLPGPLLCDPKFTYTLQMFRLRRAFPPYVCACHHLDPPRDPTSEVRTSQGTQITTQQN